MTLNLKDLKWRGGRREGVEREKEKHNVHVLPIYMYIITLNVQDTTTYCIIKTATQFHE